MRGGGYFRVFALAVGLAAGLHGAENGATTVAQLVSAVRAKARVLETSAGMRSSFASFNTAFKLRPGTVSLADYVTARLVYEATRDAGFWNLHWDITDQPPTSDRIWRQWSALAKPSPAAPTATAECDELSALYAFLMGRAGIRSVGLLWPTSNHTVAVWVIHEPARAVRVVIPTTQIFLDEDDYWGTRKFDPWRQKTIHEYARRDVPDSFELPKPLFDFFLRQADRYGAASEATLQLIRYWREAVFRGAWTREEAAREALRVRWNRGSRASEDLAAFERFAEDMKPTAAGR